MSDKDSWYFDEGVPGNGTRPDWLKSKYSNVASQAKAYVELEKRFGEAPENYDLGPLTESVDINNSHLQEFMKSAKEYRLTQDAFQKIVGTFVNYEQSTKPDVNAEIAKLGPDANKRIDIVNQWAQNHLSKKAYEDMQKLPQTAEMVLILDEMRQRMIKDNLSTTPQNNHGSDFKPINEQEIRNEIQANSQKYLNDANYRNEINRKLQLAVGTK